MLQREGWVTINGHPVLIGADDGGQLKGKAVGSAIKKSLGKGLSDVVPGRQSPDIPGPAKAGTVTMSATLYHGTSEESASKIESSGFSPPHVANGNVFGPGAYFTNSVGEAKTYGPSVLQADVHDARLASFNRGDYLDWKYDVGGSSAAETMTSYLRARGYDGLAINDRSTGTANVVLFTPPTGFSRYKEAKRPAIPANPERHGTFAVFKRIRNIRRPDSDAKESAMIYREGVDAAFRRKYGIAPKGAGPHAPSDYGLPLPPKGHPAAVSFARAVLRRAGQAENFPADAVAKQVKKAKAILAAEKTEEAVTASQLASLTTAPPKKEITEAAAAMPIVLTETAFALREDVPTLSHAAADPSVIPGVLIIRTGPGNLGDRNYYSPNALKGAVASKIFEGARCYLDHPTPMEEEQQPGRSVEDLAGWYDNITTAPYTDPETGASCTGLFGDFHPQVGRDDVASLIRTCAEYAKRFPDKAYVGLSISARGAGEPDTIAGEVWNRIDEITYVESVDIVTRAGAGGGFLPLRESFRMAAKTKKNGDGIGVTIDRDKLEEGAKALRAEVKTGVISILEKAKVKLTPEQDQALDKHLGVIDGGKIDNVLDAATGVDPDVDTESKESAKEDDMMEDDDMAEGKSPAADDEDPFREGMSDDEKVKAWAKAKEIFGKKKAEAKAKESAAAKTLAEAKKLMESARATTRAVDVDAVIAELNPPDSFRPRLRRELLESSAKTRAEIKERAQEFDAAYIRPLVERGGLGSHAAASGASSGFKFDTSLYAEA